MKHLFMGLEKDPVTGEDKLVMKGEFPREAASVVMTGQKDIRVCDGEYTNRIIDGMKGRYGCLPLGHTDFLVFFSTDSCFKTEGGTYAGDTLIFVKKCVGHRRGYFTVLDVDGVITEVISRIERIQVGNDSLSLLKL